MIGALIIYLYSVNLVLQDTTQAALRGDHRFFAELWGLVKSGVSAGWGLIKTAFLNYTPAGIIYTHWESIVEWFGALWSRVKFRFMIEWALIKAEVATWPAAMKSYGADIIQKLIDGLKSKFAALAETVRAALAKLNPFGDVQVGVDVQAAARASAGAPGESGLSSEKQAEVVARQAERLRSLGVPGYARGGTFAPGPIRVGEEGEELVYASQSGFVAHNRALRGMLGMAARTRELMSGIDFGGFGAGPVPALATVAQAGGAAMGRDITFAPQFNMPMSFDASMDADAIRQEVREELMEAHPRQLQIGRGDLAEPGER